MNPDLFLSNLSQDEILKLSPEEIQNRISAEQEFMNKQPHKDYLAATNGSKTKNGGFYYNGYFRDKFYYWDYFMFSN